MIRYNDSIPSVVVVVVLEIIATTTLVLIIVFFISHEVMIIGIISALDTSYEVSGALIAIGLSIAILLPALYWFAKRNERWMKHKFPQDRDNEEQEYEERLY